MNRTSGDDVHQPHDKSYKMLLSSKRVFVELLKSFVDRGWVNRVDEEHLIKVDKSYILQDFREKEADLVYQLRFKDRQVIFYVLMEMQSSVDFQMPYRLLLYMTEIWRDVLKNTATDKAARKGYRLPAIVPIVLYNGESPWTARRSFRETLDHQEWFGDELLDFKYILINTREYDKKKLLELSNLISTIFLLERAPDIYAFIEQMEKLTDVLEKLPSDLFPLFQTWIKLVTQRGLSEANKRRVSEIIDSYSESKEVKAMLHNIERVMENFETDTLKKGFEKGLQQGIEKGIEQGIEKGIEQGIEKGIEQGIEKGVEQSSLNIARKMLQKGMDPGTIAELTGLSGEQIDKLRKTL